MTLFERFKVARSAFSNPEWWSNVWSGGKSVSGVSVTNTTALNISAVYSAVRLASETIGTVPVQAFRKNGDTREKINHPVAELFSGMANPDMPGHILREVLQGHLELRGKAFAEIVHDVNGLPGQLWPLNPDDIVIKRNSQNELEYHHTPSGKTLPDWKVLHLRGFGSDGVNGYSVVSLGRESLGLTTAAEQFGGRYFGEGTNVGGFIRLPEGKKGLSDEAFERLKAQMNQKYKGLQKSHGLIILENGAEFQKIGLSPEDSQFLETRKFQVTEIARWFRLPPHLIGDLERATFSNIEHQGMESVRHSWLPRVTRWEAEIKNKLLANPHREKDIYIRFNLDGLLRGDVKTRYDAYHLALTDGWMNSDEVRGKEDMPQQPDGQGKLFLVPLNMVDKSTLVEEPAGDGIDGATVDNPDAGVQLNGAQVAAATEIVTLVVNGELPRDAGIGQLQVLFNLTQPQAEQVMGSAGTESFQKVEEEPARSGKPYELRAGQADILSQRRKIGESYRGKIRKAAEALVTGEIKMIRSLMAANEEDHTLREAFLSELKNHKKTYEQKMGPVLSAYASDLYPVARDEVGSEVDGDAEYESFTADYVAGYGSRHLSRTRKQVLAIIGDPDQDTREALDTRLTEWDAKRAKKIEEEETTRGRSAFVKAAFMAFGVTKLRSIAHGESCPFCNSINGKVIEINSLFFTEGESIEPEGAQSAMTFSSNIGHPPYHGGCDCDIVAELGGE